MGKLALKKAEKPLSKKARSKLTPLDRLSLAQLELIPPNESLDTKINELAQTIRRTLEEQRTRAAEQQPLLLAKKANRPLILPAPYVEADEPEEHDANEYDFDSRDLEPSLGLSPHELQTIRDALGISPATVETLFGRNSSGVQPSSTSSKHAKLRQTQLDDFALELPHLIEAFVSSAVHSDISAGLFCSFCPNDAEFRCAVCRDLSLQSLFCHNHALHHTNACFHELLDSSGQAAVFAASSHAMFCGCVSQSKSAKVRVYGFGYGSEVVVTACSDHSISWTLMRNGYMCSSANRPAYAFSKDVMERSRHEREQNLSHQSCFRCSNIPLGPEQMESNLIKYFSAALQQYCLISNQVYYGCIFEEVVDEFGPGRTICPCKGSSVRRQGNVVIKAVDGFMSAKSLTVASGGGGDFRQSKFSSQYFRRAIDCTQGEKSTAPSATPCGHNIRAGHEDSKTTKSSRYKINGIFFDVCAHELYGYIMDISKGEGLKYLDTLNLQTHYEYKQPIPEALSNALIQANPQLVRKSGHLETGGIVLPTGFIFGFRDDETASFDRSGEEGTLRDLNVYDNPCSYRAHCSKHEFCGTPYAIAAPAMHIYAHDASCRPRFNPSHRLGYGTKDWEGQERNNNLMKPGMGALQRMTSWNREKCISEKADTINRMKLSFLLPTIESQILDSMKTIADMHELAKTIDGPVGTYEATFLDNKELRKSLFTSRTRAATLKKSAATSREHLVELKHFLERSAASIREMDEKCKRHGSSAGGTALVSSLKSKTRKEYKKLVDGLEVYNKAAQDLEFDIPAFLRDVEMEDTGDDDAEDDVNLELELPTISASNSGSTPSFKPLVVQDIFDSISDSSFNDKPVYKWWRNAETLYFLWLDLHNFLHFYAEKFEGFWALTDRCVLAIDARNVAFSNAARLLVANKKSHDLKFVERTRVLLEWFESHILFPGDALKQVEDGFYNGIHKGADIL
ncbi:hypothetical protein HDU98_006440 [Podochytrium sp. JEL0797]|nr:hypothetical protein HDU98_006440 [Podochytrium sp. JEL0797]